MARTRISKEEELLLDKKKPIINDISELNGGHIKIKASMQGMKAYRVFSRRGNTDVFEAIGDSTQPEFLDGRENITANQPETRQYKLIFLEGDKPIGDYSAVEMVVTKP